jgi:hypothetical protein
VPSTARTIDLDEELDDDFADDAADAALARAQGEPFFAGVLVDPSELRSATARFGFAADALLRVLPFCSTL